MGNLLSFWHIIMTEKIESKICLPDLLLYYNLSSFTITSLLFLSFLMDVLVLFGLQWIPAGKKSGKTEHVTENPALQTAFWLLFYYWTSLQPSDHSVTPQDQYIWVWVPRPSHREISQRSQINNSAGNNVWFGWITPWIILWIHLSWV